MEGEPEVKTVDIHWVGANGIQRSFSTSYDVGDGQTKRNMGARYLRRIGVCLLANPSIQPTRLISLAVVDPLQIRFPALLRVWLRRLEPYAGKLACTVLRGGGG